MSGPQDAAPQSPGPQPMQRRDVHRRFTKDWRASPGVTDLGLIQTVYAKAIAFGGVGGDWMRGMSQMMGLGGGMISFWGASVYFRGLNVAPGVTHVAVVIFSLVGLFFLLWTYFLTVFLPGDDSVIFDRGNKKVYWVNLKLSGTGRLSAFRPGTLEISSTEWSLVDAEHRVIVKVNTATARVQHDLVFVVRKSVTDPTIAHEFGIAPGMLLSDTTTPALWELIRRYMEEGGPPLPPGTTALAPLLPKPGNWWQSMGLVGPFGPRYMHWWRTQRNITVAVHLLLPITLPLYLLWGLMNWLSYASEQTVVWPGEVLGALGPALSQAQIQAGKGGALLAPDAA